jgi:hypothetical protein
MKGHTDLYNPHSVSINLFREQNFIFTKPNGASSFCCSLCNGSMIILMRILIQNSREQNQGKFLKNLTVIYRINGGTEIRAFWRESWGCQAALSLWKDKYIRHISVRCFKGKVIVYIFNYTQHTSKKEHGNEARRKHEKNCSKAKASSCKFYLFNFNCIPIFSWRCVTYTERQSFLPTKKENLLMKQTTK